MGEVQKENEVQEEKRVPRGRTIHEDAKRALPTLRPGPPIRILREGEEPPKRKRR